MAHFLPEVDVESSLEDDYYALLNLRKNASAEDITNSYRRLSKLYHPDKHIDPLKKKNAEILFNKTKNAYEVLNDPHKRAIYDTLGIKGLQTEGWQIIERTKSPREIREEFELLLKEKEERRLQQRTNPKGTIVVGINATDLFETYDIDFGFPNFEISSMTISQSIEAPLTLNDTARLNGNLSSQNGTGTGSISCSMKKIISSKTWLEFSLGAGNGLIYTLKGFCTLSKHCFSTIQTSFHFTSLGISPGLEIMLAKQLDKHAAGYITWKVGNISSINTTLVWDSDKRHIITGFQLGTRGSFITINYTHRLREAKFKTALKFGTFGVIAEYGCEKKVSQHSTLSATMAIGIPSGVTLKMKITRANQSYVFPILLSEDLIPSAVFYGTVFPIVGWYMLKTFIIEPYNLKQRKRESEKMKEMNAERMAEKQKESKIAVSLMQETYKRIKTQEQGKNGLIIKLAIYGNAQEIANFNKDEIERRHDVFDVTIQLQCLVKDSILILPDRAKSNLPGFYDPCIGEEKSLYVEYIYRNQSDSCIIKDDEMLRIP